VDVRRDGVVDIGDVELEQQRGSLPSEVERRDPLAAVSRAGTSSSPESGATKLLPAEAGDASATSASASMRTSPIVLRISLSSLLH